MIIMKALLQPISVRTYCHNPHQCLGEPDHKIVFKIKPPAAETANSPVAVCIIRAGSIVVLP